MCEESVECTCTFMFVSANLAYNEESFHSLWNKCHN